MYVTKEEVKKMRDTIKKEFPAKDGWKFSIRNENYSKVNVCILKAPINLNVENKNYFYVLEHNIEKLYKDQPEAQKFFKRIFEIIEGIKPCYNRNAGDPTADYPDYNYVYNVNVGKWDVPFLYNPVEKKAPKKEKVDSAPVKEETTAVTLISTIIPTEEKTEKPVESVSTEPPEEVSTTEEKPSQEAPVGPVTDFNDYYDTFKSAWNNISFDPEKRAKSYIDFFNSELREDLKQLSGPNNYEKKYVDHALDWVSKMSRTVSSMIVGPANFPTSRAQKAFQSESKAWENFRAWRERYIKAVNRVPTPSPEDDLEIALADYEKAVNHQNFMKAINKIIRNKKLSNEEKIQKIIDDWGYSLEKAKKIFVPDVCGDIGYPHYKLTNNNAKIKRLGDKVLVMKNRIERKKNWEPIPFDGGKIDIADDRIIIYYDEKPEEEQRMKMKKRGFRCSPKRDYGWCRKHTQNALYDAKQLCGVK